MKVWVVVAGHHEDWWIAGIFSSKEKASEFMASEHRSGYSLYGDEGVELDEQLKYPGV